MSLHSLNPSTQNKKSQNLLLSGKDEKKIWKVAILYMMPTTYCFTNYGQQKITKSVKINTNRTLTVMTTSWVAIW